MFRLSTQKGQSTIELMVALFLVSIITAVFLTFKWGKPKEEISNSQARRIIHESLMRYLVENKTFNGIQGIEDIKPYIPYKTVYEKITDKYKDITIEPVNYDTNSLEGKMGVNGVKISLINANGGSTIKPIKFYVSDKLIKSKNLPKDYSQATFDRIKQQALHDVSVIDNNSSIEEDYKISDAIKSHDIETKKQILKKHFQKFRSNSPIDKTNK